MNKTFVMGDVHGCYRGLLQCLERSGFDKENDTLIQIGDVADGWSEVPECVEELLTIKKLIPIRGNHDVWCWNWFTLGQTPIMWTQQGGQATIDAYIRTGLLVDKRHKDFWNNQIDYYIDEHNRLFVHAGFDLVEGFEWSKTSKVNIPNSTELHWNRDLADTDAKVYEDIYGKQPQHLLKFNEIFIGHTAHNSNRYNKFYNVWNVDSGAGWSGFLTIMNVDTKEYFTSDWVVELYPNEKGRR